MSTTIAPAAPLSPGAALPLREVVRVHMASMSAGVGVAILVGPGLRPGPQLQLTKGPQYLVRTVDGGASWRAVSKLPMRYVNGYDAPSVLFAQGRAVYIEGGVNVDPRIVFSTDRGARWRHLRVAGALESAAVFGSKLWVTAAHCVRVGSDATSTTCRTYVTIYALGLASPESSFPVRGSTIRVAIPVLMGLAGTSLELAGPIGGDGAVVLEDVGGGVHPSIISTLDGGRTWRSLKDPCATTYLASLSAPRALHWVLYCSRGYGMNQGLNALFASSDLGVSWRVVARSGPTRTRDVGKFNDVMSAAFGVSNDATHLWQVTTVGPFEQSADSGRVWTSPSNRPNVLQPSPFDEVGAHGAFVVDVENGIWRTADGVHWHFLRGWPAR